MECEQQDLCDKPCKDSNDDSIIFNAFHVVFENKSIQVDPTIPIPIINANCQVADSHINLPCIKDNESSQRLQDQSLLKIEPQAYFNQTGRPRGRPRKKSKRVCASKSTLSCNYSLKDNSIPNCINNIDNNQINGQNMGSASWEPVPELCFDRLCPPDWKFIPRSKSNSEDVIDYELEEEDFHWLNIVNDRKKQNEKSRKNDSYPDDKNNSSAFNDSFNTSSSNANSSSNKAITPDDLEFLIDKFEKSCFLVQMEHKDVKSSKQAHTIESSNLQVSEKTSHHVTVNYLSDEDAICSVCLDGECYHNNLILFCDLCNLPVHQECYGVPCIPEGQWLCRRCLQCPADVLQCALCPSKGGAFKQTVDQEWVHVACILWLEELYFLNLVFMEPVCSMAHLPERRRRLKCSLCDSDKSLKQYKHSAAGRHIRKRFACIQCAFPACFDAFHVTCAPRAGLLMLSLPITRPSQTLVEIQNNSICEFSSGNSSISSDNFRPISPDVSMCDPVLEIGETNDTPHSILFQRYVYCKHHTPVEYISKESQRESEGNIEVAIQRDIEKRKQKADRIYNQYQSSKFPVACQPYIPKATLEKLQSQALPNRDYDFKKVFNYWKLKRWSRSGASLIRHLPQKVKTDYKQLLHIDPDFADYLKVSTVDTMSNDREASNVYSNVNSTITSTEFTRQDKASSEVTGSYKIRQKSKTKHSARASDTCSKNNNNSSMDLFDHICAHLQKEDLSDPTKLVNFLDSLDVRHYFYDLKNNQSNNDNIMDFKSMMLRLKNGEYSETSKIWDDFYRILDQCYSRLSSRHSLYRYAKRMEKKAMRVVD